jgi:translation initiation factor 2B subunit (eIF-2B alpha/beta/delta family)
MARIGRSMVISKQCAGAAVSTTTDHAHDDNDNSNLLLVGADYIYQDAIVNKVNTKRSAKSSSSCSRCHVVCCADRFKLWDGAFPLPLEDMFECVPMTLFDRVQMPQPSAMEQWKPFSQL